MPKVSLISSIIERFDNKVPSSKGSKFNALVSKLCERYEVEFIDNSNITKEMLNGSNLHLNSQGNRALGKSFCNYLRSIRLPHTVNLYSKHANFRTLSRTGIQKLLNLVRAITST